jgi:hypothetical protein
LTIGEDYFFVSSTMVVLDYVLIIDCVIVNNPSIHQ